MERLSIVVRWYVPYRMVRLTAEFTLRMDAEIALVLFILRVGHCASLILPAALIIRDDCVVIVVWLTWILSLSVRI